MLRGESTHEPEVLAAELWKELRAAQGALQATGGGLESEGRIGHRHPTTAGSRATSGLPGKRTSITLPSCPPTTVLDRKDRVRMDTSQRIKVRIERLVAKGSSVLATQRRPSSPNVTYPTSVNTGAFAEWRTQSLSLLTNILGAEHVYVASFERDVKGTHTGSVEAGIGILKAVGEDLEDGYLTDVRTLVSAEVFTDFLDMVEHLLEHGYKDPAASLCGAVLEQGLRRIATNRGFRVRERDDLSALNQKLASKGVYTRLVQKRLGVWTDVRNAADHGRFTEYSKEDVCGDAPRSVYVSRRPLDLRVAMTGYQASDPLAFQTLLRSGSAVHAKAD